MKTQYELERALLDSRDAVQDGELMSRQSIESLLASTPLSKDLAKDRDLTSNPGKVPSSSLLSKSSLIAGVTLAAASVATVMILNSPDDAIDANNVVLTSPTPVTEVQRSVEQPNIAMDVAPAPTNAEDLHSYNRSSNGMADEMRASSPASTDANVTTPSTPVDVIATNDAELYKALGLNVSSDRVVLYDKGIKITATASGVSSPIAQNDRPVMQFESPKLIVIYQDKSYFASYWNINDTAFSVTSKKLAPNTNLRQAELINNMIAVSVPLSNTGTIANSVQVVFWYVPSQSLIDRMPERYRNEFAQRLGMITSTSLGSSTTNTAAQHAFATAYVYPNPVRTTQPPTLAITFMKETISTAIVRDLFGQPIATLWKDAQHLMGEMREPIVGLEQQPSGMYTIEISTQDGQRIVERLMIQR